MALKRVDAQIILDIILPKEMKMHDPNNPSDREVEALYAMWKTSPPGANVFSVPVEHRGLINQWKAKGLVSGFSDSLSLTDKGKKVIIEMVTNEPNAFEKSAKAPSYSQVKAKKDSTGKTGVKRASKEGHPYNRKRMLDDTEDQRQQG